MIFGNPFLGRGWIEEYYTESRSWTAPPGVNNLIILEMRGGTGVAAGYSFTPVVIAVRRIGSGYLHQISKSTLNSEALTEYNKFPSTPGGPPSGVSVTWNQTHYITGGPAPTVNQNITKFYSVRPGQVKAQVGSPGYVPGWGTTGNWNPGDAMMSWSIDNLMERGDVPAAPGGNTTAFGRSANGGAAGGGVGQVTSHNNVSIVPGQSYNLNIPNGGYVRIIY